MRDAILAATFIFLVEVTKVVLFVTLTGCGTDDSTEDQLAAQTAQKCGPHECDKYYYEDHELEEYQTFYVTEKAEMGLCREKDLSKLVYVSNEQTFYSCQSQGWVVVNIEGKPGPQGPAGDSGEDGSDGKDAETPDPYEWFDELTGKTWHLSTTKYGSPWVDGKHKCEDYGLTGPKRSEWMTALENGIWLHYPNNFTTGFSSVWLIDDNDPGLAYRRNGSDGTRMETGNGSEACIDGSCSVAERAAIYCFE